MIVLDTTVLVYAVGVEHPLREPCRALVAAAADGRVVATTTVEVLQEFTHVRARRRSDAASLARDYVDLLSPLVQVGEADLVEGLRLLSSTEGLGAFDAVLAAAASRIEATALVSADAAFGRAGVTHVLPDVDGVATLLSG